MAEAREMRYELLYEACKAEKINFLFTGHQNEDQIETFFMRLGMNSGIEGKKIHGNF